MLNQTRRGFIGGLAMLVAAPAIVRVASLMPVKVMPVELEVYGRSPAMSVLPDLMNINERLTRFTGLPQATWRLYYQGIPWIRNELIEDYVSA